MKNDNQTHDKPLKVGDRIVDFGQVYKIFKIDKRKVVHFKPYYKTKRNSGLTCSIPVKNIGLTHIRKPVSKKKLRQLLKRLSVKPEANKPINTKQAKDALNHNDLQKTVQILKRIWLDKNDESTNLTKAKKDILDLSMERLVEEVAFVSGISVAQARKRIKKRLKKD